MKHAIKKIFFFLGLTVIIVTGLQAQVACKCWLHIDSTFQVVPMTVGFDTDVGVAPLYENDNATSPAITLPFNFCFYGNSYSSVYISNNGIVSFTRPIHDFIDSTQQFPLGGDTMVIAPFYADANTNNHEGVVYYKITPTHMVVIWDSVRYKGSDVDGWNTFQLIISNGNDPVLPDGTNLQFCYPEMQWSCADASGGFSGYGGTPAFVGINKGDGTTYAQIGTFAKPGDFYYGSFSPYNGVDWLDFQSFSLNTCVQGGIVAPVIANDVPICNTLYVCPCDTTSADAALGAHDSALVHPCDTLNFTGSFLCAVPGQNATFSYNCTGALNIDSVTTFTQNYLDSVVVQAIPVFGDTGSHVLTITATDTVNHLQSSISYKIIVTTACIDSPPQPAAIGALLKDGFSVYPNPADKYIGIQISEPINGATAKIFDVFGAQVFEAQLSGPHTAIDISGFAKGLYFVELFKAGNLLPVKKIIVQ
jgi:Secretion system C-terminal sorting domain